MKLAQDLITYSSEFTGTFFTEHDEANLGSLLAIETSGKQDELIHVGLMEALKLLKPLKREKIDNGRLYAATCTDGT